MDGVLLAIRVAASLTSLLQVVNDTDRGGASVMGLQCTIGVIIDSMGECRRQEM